MAINKVEYGGNTLIDLTSDNVTPENLLSGVTAHDASGTKITGTFDSDKYLEKIGDASDTTVTFVQATNRANISSKEKFSVIMGKIAKFFADLKTVAFTGKYSDLSGTPGVVSKTANGLCPKNGGTTTKFLRDDGTYAEPTASVSGLSTLEQVTAAAMAGNVTNPVGAGAVNELNSSLTDGDKSFNFGVTTDGKPGYHWKVDGADTVIPFSKGGLLLDFYLGAAIGLGRQPNATINMKYDVKNCNYAQVINFSPSYNPQIGKFIRMYKVDKDYIPTNGYPSGTLISTIDLSNYNADTKYNISDVDYLVVSGHILGEDSNSDVWRSFNAKIVFE